MASSEDPTTSDAAQLRMLNQLNEMERKVVQVRFFGPEAPQSLEESALILSLPVEEVADIEEAAMAKLGQSIPPSQDQERKKP
jgi:DNA-directed RNA polymerase sigma subunit (sigma70/sigma32)